MEADSDRAVTDAKRARKVSFKHVGPRREASLEDHTANSIGRLHAEIVALYGHLPRVPAGMPSSIWFFVALRYSRIINCQYRIIYMYAKIYEGTLRDQNPMILLIHSWTLSCHASAGRSPYQNPRHLAAWQDAERNPEKSLSAQTGCAVYDVVRWYHPLCQHEQGTEP